MSDRYRTLFAVPGFAPLLFSSMLGRLPSGMFSLAILLFVHAHTHSFLAAGVAVGAFALAGAATGPPLGALVDRIGQRRVLLSSATGQAAMLAALLAVAGMRAPTAAIVGLCAIAGALQPPIAGCIRALWPELAPDGDVLETAYALDATTQEVIWILGPLLVGTAVDVLSPAAAVALCAAVTLFGTTLFASSRLSKGWRAAARVGRSGALASRGLRRLLGTVLLAGAVIGTVEVGLPALAVEEGARWAAGPLMALFSVGSMAGGVAYSLTRWRLGIEARYRAMLLAMALAVSPLMVAHSLVAGFLLSVAAGAGVAPMLSSQFSLVGALASAGTATEAFAWHRAAIVAGMAGGSALGGWLIQLHGAGSAFALGCGCVTLAYGLATLWRSRIDPDAQARSLPSVSSAAPS